MTNEKNKMEHVPKLGRPELLMKKNGAHPKIDKLKFWTCPPTQ
jgi:hypothetical protein